MNALHDLYQEMILDHAKSPKNWGHIAERTHCAKGHNPLCGDHIVLELKVLDNIIIDIAFSGDGCAISKASSSLMTEAVKGKTIGEASDIFTNFHHMLTLDNEDQAAIDALGKLGVFLGVKQFPMRVKCATLSWHTLQAAMHNQNDQISTE
jgi:nitrogen fixation NifU-like protein